MAATDDRADLCIMVLSFNRPEYLRQTLSSILGQRLRPKRIMVLDNGSTLPVKEHIKNELDQGVEWIGADPGHPSIWNFRRAMELAEGKYFMMMHDDDRLLPQFTERMVTFLEAHPDVIAVACNAHVIDDSGNRVGSRLCREEREKEKIFKDQPELVLHSSRSFLPFPSIVYRNGLPQKVPLKEEYGKVGDSIFLCELAEHGKMAYLDEALFEYRVHSGQDSSIWPFNEIRHRDDIFMDMVKNDKRYRSKIRRNLSRFETRQALMTVLTCMMTERSIRNALRKMWDVRSPLFNPCHIPAIMIEERRNIVLLSRRIGRFIN